MWSKGYFLKELLTLKIAGQAGPLCINSGYIILLSIQTEFIIKIKLFELSLFFS